MGMFLGLSCGAVCLPSVWVCLQHYKNERGGGRKGEGRGREGRKERKTIVGGRKEVRGEGKKRRRRGRF